MMNESNFNKLFEPIQIGSMTIKNRIAMAPMGTAFATLDGLFTEQAMAYYEARAKGGVGLIIIENVGVDFHRHIHASNRPAIDSDLPPAAVGKAIKNMLGVIIQLNHSGRMKQVQATGFQPRTLSNPVQFRGFPSGRNAEGINQRRNK
jgi:2,4-dienoyl-CoA reductase-like NADH-dependent reductase (Old Yellow Enzyme family)